MTVTPASAGEVWIHGEEFTAINEELEAPEVQRKYGNAAHIMSVFFFVFFLEIKDHIYFF